MGHYSVFERSAQDRKGLEDSKTYPEVLKKLNPVLDGTPRVDTYDTMFTLIH